MRYGHVRSRGLLFAKPLTNDGSGFVGVAFGKFSDPVHGLRVHLALDLSDVDQLRGHGVGKQCLTGSAGLGSASQLCGLMFMSTTDTKLTPVYYFKYPGFQEWTVRAVRTGRATISPLHSRLKLSDSLQTVLENGPTGATLGGSKDLSAE